MEEMHDVLGLTSHQCPSESVLIYPISNQNMFPKVLGGPEDVVTVLCFFCGSICFINLDLLRLTDRLMHKSKGSNKKPRKW